MVTSTECATTARDHRASSLVANVNSDLGQQRFFPPACHFNRIVGTANRLKRKNLACGPCPKPVRSVRVMYSRYGQRPHQRLLSDKLVQALAVQPFG